MKQLRVFIPDLNIEKETEMIVTKCDTRKQPRHIVNTLRKNIDLNYLEEKVTIINYPCDSHHNPFDRLDIHEIASRMPSITSKIQLVISADSRVDLEEHHDKLAY